MTDTKRAATLATRLTPGVVLTLVSNPFNRDREGTRTTVLAAPDRSTGRVLVQEGDRPPYRWQLPGAPSVTWDGDLFTYPLRIDSRADFPRTVTYRIEQ